MRSRVISKTYTLLERDETGLIPEEVFYVEVRFDEQNKPLSLAYSHKEAVPVYQGKELNAKKPTTQEGIDKIVMFLERSSKF